MNAEYQRLEAEASEVQNQIDELVKSCGQMGGEISRRLRPKSQGSINGWPDFGKEWGCCNWQGPRKCEHRRRSWQSLSRRRFILRVPAPKTVKLTGGVTVTLYITYYHRLQAPEMAKNKKANRGMFFMLILLGIANGFTAGVRQRMMKCAG